MLRGLSGEGTFDLFARLIAKHVAGSSTERRVFPQSHRKVEPARVGAKPVDRFGLVQPCLPSAPNEEGASSSRSSFRSRAEVESPASASARSCSASATPLGGSATRRALTARCAAVWSQRVRVIQRPPSLPATRLRAGRTLRRQLIGDAGHVFQMSASTGIADVIRSLPIVPRRPRISSLSRLDREQLPRSAAHTRPIVPRPSDAPTRRRLAGLRADGAVEQQGASQGA